MQNSYKYNNIRIFFFILILFIGVNFDLLSRFDPRQNGNDSFAVFNETWMGYACIQFSFLRFMRDKLSRVVGSKNRKNDFYIHLYKICLHPDIFYSIFIYQQGRKGKPRAKFSNFPFLISIFFPCRIIF